MKVINHTQNKCRHYLYQYVRLDTNQPFYVGVGTRHKSQTDFGRARNIAIHNKHCINITDKINYIIEILEESDDYGDIQQREIALIAQHGRITSGGILANYTDGGGGKLNADYSYSEKPVYCYTKAGLFHMEFKSGVSAAAHFNVTTASISAAINQPDVVSLIKGYQFRLEKHTQISPALNRDEKIVKYLAKPITQLTRDGNAIQEWVSCRAAARSLKVSPAHINECCVGKRKSAGGFCWQYK